MSRFDAAKIAFTLNPAHLREAIPELAFPVRAAVAWWSCQPGHGREPGNRGGIGLWAPDRAVAVAWSSQDAASTISTQSAAGDVALLGLGRTSEEGGMRAELETTREGALALRWTERPSEPWTVHVLALGGQVAAETAWTDDLASSVERSTADLVLALPAPASAREGLVIGLGAAGRHDSGAAAYSAREAAPPGTVLASQRRGAATVEPDRRHAYLTLDGVRTHVASDRSPTRPRRRLTRVDFTPHALLLFSWGLAPSREQRGIGRFCLGAAAGGGRGCTSWDDCNIDTPVTRTHVASSDQRALLVADTLTGGIHAEADVSVDDRGFTLDWIRSDGHRREFLYVALGARQRSASSSGK